MPLVEISLVEGALNQNQKVKMANDIFDLLIKAIPNVPKDAISVIFYENPSENWIAGGLTVKELMKRTKK